MFDNVIAEKSNKQLLIFTTTNKLFPVRNNPTFNHLLNFCSEHRLGSMVPFCLFDRVLNVIFIKDIDDNGCKLKARDLIFYKIKCHLTKGSKPFCIYWLQQSYASVTSCIIETSCSSWCARSTLLVLRIVPSSWNNDVGIGQMIHWFQSIEGLLLLALDGRSGLPNCAIFWKTLATVPTNDFLTTCKH